MRATHACRHERQGLRAASAGAPGRLRKRGAPPQLHPRRRRDRADAVGGEPAGARPRGAARRAALSPPAPRPRPDRGRRRVLRRDDRGAQPARSRDPRASPQRARADGRRHDDAGLRGALADPAADGLRRRASRRRRADLGEQRGRRPRPRRRRPGDPLSRRFEAPARATAFASSARRCRRSAARACCGRRTRRWRGPPISPPTRSCEWSPTAATSCRTGASGCRR